MPRDWTREHREDRREPWDDRREPQSRSRDDFGQADFSTDYGYDPQRRAGYRTADAVERRGEDYGQADYSTDYAFDPAQGRAYRRLSEDDRDYGRAPPSGPYRDDRDRFERDDRVGERGRSWADRAGAFFSGRPDEGEGAQRRRRGPSDRVIWAVIVERLEDERGLDLRDVEVLVENAEVTLNGAVRRKEDKRRIEDIADIDGVRHVQNNLRVRGGGRGWF